MTSRRVKRTRQGDYQLRLPEEERGFLRTVPSVVRELLAEEDPAVARLFPVAYPDDEDRETEYRLLVHDELRESHLAALSALEGSVDAQRLDEEHLLGWMRALNQVRLILGTRLGVTEEGDERPLSRDDPRMPVFEAYDYLTALQGEIIDALED